MFDRLQSLANRYKEIENLLSQEDIAFDVERLSRLAKERSDIEPIVNAFREYQAVAVSIREAKEILDGPDDELASLANEELSELTGRHQSLEKSMVQMLLPRDPNDDRNVIMEIRGATGGDEAGIFAADLYRMYFRFAQSKGWKVSILDSSEGNSGGVKEVILEIEGNDAYKYLKQESGVHRVQRVPVTEAQGRIHTSTATVAVLPQAEEVDIQIKPEDLRIDIFHAGGAGGQNVNKVATAVRIVHLPTGMTTVCQDERSQLRNRQKAMTVLRSRLFEMEMIAQQEKTTSARRSQVGGGERSEKIRTYNFPQDRLTDHRIGMSFHGLDSILAGELTGIVGALLDYDQKRLLQEIGT